MFIHVFGIYHKCASWFNVVWKFKFIPSTFDLVGINGREFVKKKYML